MRPPYIIFIISLGSFGFYFSYKFFNPTAKDQKTTPFTLVDPLTGKHSLQNNQSQQIANQKAAILFSETWRVTGYFQVDNTLFVAVTNASGRVRLEHPSNFQNTGTSIIGKIDGETVTMWSGTLPAEVQAQVKK